jgi:hypothetical protein
VGGQKYAEHNITGTGCNDKTLSKDKEQSKFWGQEFQTHFINMTLFIQYRNRHHTENRAKS